MTYFLSPWDKMWLPSAAAETWGWQVFFREMPPEAQEFTALYQKTTATVIFTKPNHATLRPTRLRKAMTQHTSVICKLTAFCSINNTFDRRGCQEREVVPNRYTHILFGITLM